MDVTREADTTTPVRQAMNVMSEGIGTADILDEMQNNTMKVAFQGSSFVLSAGFLTWALRGASLLASVAASMPAWAGLRPAAGAGREKTRQEDRYGRAGRR